MKSVMLGFCFLSTILLFPILASAQDVDPGERAFNQCRACHQVGPTARNVVGPHLNGLFGREAGSVPGFNYSPANKASGIVWNEDNFRSFITNPRQQMPGTRMAYGGLKDEAQVSALIDHLKKY